MMSRIVKGLFGRREQRSRDWEEGDGVGHSAVAGAPDAVPYIHRSAVVLRPKKPFVDWLNQECGEPMSLRQARALPDRTVYLLEPWAGTWDSPQALASHAREILERELEEWTTDRSRWPRRRDGKLLQEWFDVEPCSGVVDLAGGKLNPLHLE